MAQQPCTKARFEILINKPAHNLLCSGGILTHVTKLNLRESFATERIPVTTQATSSRTPQIGNRETLIKASCKSGRARNLKPRINPGS